jgi:tRNA(Ile)-lysidine synthase TilS/MesJ
MIEAGDKVMVCLSGGKDSYAMLDVLLALREKSPVPFELVAMNLDQRHPGFPERVLPDYLESRGVPYRIEVQDTYSVVKRVIPEGRPCAACARACAAACSIASRASWAPPRSRSGTTATTSSRPSSSISSTAGS